MLQLIHCVVLINLIKLMLSAHKCNIVIKCADPLSVEGNCLERMPRDEIYFYNYTKCTDGKACEKSEVTGEEVFVKCIDKAQRKNLYDGQECEKNEQCYSKNCTNGICLGKKKGMSCISTDECATRHYCKMKVPGQTPPDLEDPDRPNSEKSNKLDLPTPFSSLVDRIVSTKSMLIEPLIPLILPKLPSIESTEEGEGVCTPQEKKGGICKTEYDCMNNATCGVGNQCVEYFSYENGETSDNPIICKSNHIGNKKDVSNVNVCVAYKRVETSNECKENQTQCTYKSTGAEKGKVDDKTEDCKCSLGNPDKMYCPYDPSGAEYTEYLNLMKKYYRVEAHDYHTKLRHESVDPQLKRNLFLYKNYPKYFNVDNCAVEFGMISSFVSHSYLGMIAVILGILL